MISVSFSLDVVFTYLYSFGRLLAKKFPYLPYFIPPESSRKKFSNSNSNTCRSSGTDLSTISSPIDSLKDFGFRDSSSTGSLTLEMLPPAKNWSEGNDICIICLTGFVDFSPFVLSKLEFFLISIVFVSPDIQPS